MATAKVLVVAGWWGGSIGYGWGGWGWAGWLLYDAALSITAGANSVTVWNWWAGWIDDVSAGTDWGNSVFGSLTAIWGWCNPDNLWAPWAVNWNNWWSGGGGHWTGTGWAGTALQWNAGGWSSDTAPYYGGGWGGGAGGAGATGDSWTGGGAGWVGSAYSISGSSVTYAWWGGGGGGLVSGAAWWSGGWWNGGNSAGSAPTNWTNWLWGWGGAGGGSFIAGWNWGSGIVIISYATDGSDWISTSSTWGTVTTSGANTIHTFTASWTFTAVASAVANNGAWMFAFFFS